MPNHSRQSDTQRQTTVCFHCKNLFPLRRGNPNKFCSIACKSADQCLKKPVTKEWLIQKYQVEGMSANEIAKIVGRNSKRVWEWLRDFGIPTRKRGSNKTTYFKKGEPGRFKGRKHSKATREKLSKIAKADGRVPFDPKIGPPFKGKRGAEIPSWKGGVTPERQAFYASKEWKDVVSKVWIRDNATCQKCSARSKGSVRVKLEAHHIVSFSEASLRAELTNLVLLCRKCHLWVHSSKNTKKEFIKELEPNAGSI